jgi:hypothetical protein
MEDRGLARPPLGLLETLRPWHGAGLLHVLLPEGEGAPSADAAAAGAEVAAQPDTDVPDMGAFPAACDAPASMCGDTSAQPGGYAGQDGNGGDPSFDPDAYDIPLDPMFDQTTGGSLAGAEYQFAGRGQVRPVPPQGLPGAQRSAQPAPGAGLAETSLPVASGPSASTLPPERWPGQWRDLFSRTPQPAPVLWTYWALGLDLSGCADAARRDTLRRILGALRQPKGSNAFWPVSMPDASGDAPASGAEGASGQPSEPIVDPALFLAGMERIAPRLVVVMGSKALRAFAPDLRARPYQQIPWRGRLLIVLPDMDNLIAAPATVEAVIAYLRTALKPATL